VDSTSAPKGGPRRRSTSTRNRIAPGRARHPPGSQSEPLIRRRLSAWGPVALEVSRPSTGLAVPDGGRPSGRVGRSQAPSACKTRSESRAIRSRGRRSIRRRAPPRPRRALPERPMTRSTRHRPA
jgi:hypothetical protein